MLKGISLLVALATFSGQASAHAGEHGTYIAFEAIGLLLLSQSTSRNAY